jgi:hypothetical protein
VIVLFIRGHIDLVVIIQSNYVSNDRNLISEDFVFILCDSCIEQACGCCVYS